MAKWHNWMHDVKQVRLGTIEFGGEEFDITQMLQHPNGKQVIKLINFKGEESEMTYYPHNWRDKF